MTRIKQLWMQIKPTVVLVLIAMITSGMLVIAYNITYVDTSGIITDKMQESAVEILGEGSFKLLENTEFDGVESVIIDQSREMCAFHLIVNGYAKDGLELLIGMNKDGEVLGISVISIAETPGLGTKVDSPDFLNQFKGITSAEFKVDNITSATYSSNGIKNAVKIAINTYNSHKEEIFSE